ncbi:hypothetical protein SLEP1_g53260 [Rubroshorea leprosula]|uniref:Uncharacterized protein n=1 Tax=Rubroshorea leprosula TaxID=152421 RepID=A0AAV5MBP7_9ROSI|nr:hypothetical protein SLEP1_g53260 [Rubroshorea leprosula]
MAEGGKEKRTGADEAGNRRRPGRPPGPPLSEEEEKKKREEKNRKIERMKTYDVSMFVWNMWLVFGYGAGLSGISILTPPWSFELLPVSSSYGFQVFLVFLSHFTDVDWHYGAVIPP